MCFWKEPECFVSQISDNPIITLGGDEQQQADEDDDTFSEDSEDEPVHKLEESFSGNLFNQLEH